MALAKSVGASVRPGFQTPLQVLENKKIEIEKKKYELAMWKMLDQQWNKRIVKPGLAKAKASPSHPVPPKAMAEESKDAAMPKDEPSKNKPEDQNTPVKEPDESDHHGAMLEDQNKPKDEPSKNDDCGDAKPEDQNTPEKEPDESDRHDEMLEDQNKPKEKPKEEHEERKPLEIEKKPKNMRAKCAAKAKGKAKLKPASKVNKVAKKTKKEDTNAKDPSEMSEEILKKKLHSVLILDDSGSMMNSSKPAGQRSLFEAGGATRWDELKESAALLIDLACCFDRSGVDIFFLNNGLIDGRLTSFVHWSAQDERLRSVFDANRLGRTPLTEAVQTVAQHCKGERPILLIIFTDGEPNGGVKKFEKELKRLVTKKSTDMTVKVQIMACTADQDAVGYLNDIDEKFSKVDVTDDYYSEQHEVVVKARKRPQFTRGDWLMKALLGPISHKFDDWDETGKKKKACKHCDDSDCSSDFWFWMVRPGLEAVAARWVWQRLTKQPAAEEPHNLWAELISLVGEEEAWLGWLWASVAARLRRDVPLAMLLARWVAVLRPDLALHAGPLGRLVAMLRDQESGVTSRSAPSRGKTHRPEEPMSKELFAQLEGTCGAEWQQALLVDLLPRGADGVLEIFRAVLREEELVKSQAQASKCENLPTSAFQWPWGRKLKTAKVGFLCARMGVSFMLPAPKEELTRRGVMAMAGIALGFEASAKSARAFGDAPDDWFGYYSDPQHPGCTRKIEYDGYGPMVVTGTDGNPGCLGRGPVLWQMGLGEDGGDTLIFDFSSKGGPANVEGKWDGTGIVFPDGNKQKTHTAVGACRAAIWARRPGIEISTEDRDPRRAQDPWRKWIGLADLLLASIVLRLGLRMGVLSPSAEDAFDSFAHFTRQQVNLQKEVDLLRQVRSALCSLRQRGVDAAAQVSLPRPIGHAQPEVAIVSWEDGICLSEVTRRPAFGGCYMEEGELSSRRAAAKHLARTFWLLLFEHHIALGGLCAGNVLLRTAMDDEEQLEVVLLRCGLCHQVDAETVQDLKHLTQLLRRGADSEEVGHLILTRVHCRSGGQAEQVHDLDGFFSSINSLLGKSAGCGVMPPLRGAVLLHRFLEILHTHKVKASEVHLQVATSAAATHAVCSRLDPFSYGGLFEALLEVAPDTS
eukprot:s1200_g3.t1